MSQRLMKAAMFPQDVKRLRMVLIGSKKNIWHSCQEEPEKGEFIVTEFCDIGKCYEIDSASWTEDWGEHCSRNHIMAWCYVSDLLP